MVEATVERLKKGKVELTPFVKLEYDDKLARVRALQGSLPPLQEVLDARRSVWVRYGRSEKDKQSSETRIRAEYSTVTGLFDDVSERLNGGEKVSIRGLQGSHNVGRDSITRLLDGGLPEFMRYMPDEFTITVPFEEDADFAFLLGYETGKAWSSDSGDIYYRSHDEKVVVRLRDEVAKVRGKVNKYYDDGDYFIFEVPCPELADYVRDATDNKSRVAWEHAKTEKERLAFLQGYLATRMGELRDANRDGLSYAFFRLSKEFHDVPKDGEPGLFNDLQILFGKFGIQSTVWKSKKSDRWFLDVNELSSLNRILELRLLPQAKHTRLKGLFDKVVEQRKGPGVRRRQGSYTPEQYDAVMVYQKEYALVKEDPVSSGFASPRTYLKHVAQKVNRSLKRKHSKDNVFFTHDVNLDVTRLWLSGERTPLSVVKRDAVAEKENELYGKVDDIPRIPYKLEEAVKEVDKKIWGDYDLEGDFIMFTDLEGVADRVCRRRQCTRKQFYGCLYETLKVHQVERGLVDEPEVEFLMIELEEKLGIRPDIKVPNRTYKGKK
jgi:hypothetical protein